MRKWKALIETLAVALFATAILAATTDIASPAYYGKTNIKKAYTAIDANFATVEAGTSFTVLSNDLMQVYGSNITALGTLNVTGAATFSGSFSGTIVNSNATGTLTASNGTFNGTLLVTGVATHTAQSVHTGGIDANGASTMTNITLDAGSTLTATGATINASNATINANAATVSGAYTNSGAVDFTAAITTTNITMDAGAELSIDGKYAITGGDASTGLMVQKAAITSTAAIPQTNSFAVAFGAAPIVVCTYTEDPGDVQPIYVTAVTTSNFVCSVTSSKNFGYVAVGTRP